MLIEHCLASPEFSMCIYIKCCLSKLTSTGPSPLLSRNTWCEDIYYIEHAPKMLETAAKHQRNHCTHVCFSLPSLGPNITHQVNPTGFIGRVLCANEGIALISFININFLKHVMFPYSGPRGANQNIYISILQLGSV